MKKKEVKEIDQEYLQRTIDRCNAVIPALREISSFIFYKKKRLKNRAAIKALSSIQNKISEIDQDARDRVTEAGGNAWSW